MKNIRPTDSVIGATVYNVSLAEMPSAATIDWLEVALERHGVLIFPKQHISPKQQIDFSAALGPLDPTELESARLDGFEEIFVVGNAGKGIVSFSPENEDQDLEWHTDHIHREVPARASLLYAKEVPDAGGDTLFACMYHAYDSLDNSDKQAYSKLKMIHSTAGLERYLVNQNLGNTDGAQREGEHAEIIRPLIRVHPVTGRKALYFGNQITVGVVGWEQTRADQFLFNLTKHACQPAFQYRHKWRVGDAVLWDNRRVLHAGTYYDVEHSRRLMHRTTLIETESP